MRSIIGSSLRLRRLVVAAAAGLVIIGATQLSNGSIDALPEFSPPYVEVQTEALGLSAEEVEQLITVPLEADLLNGVAWLDSIESESVPGLSSIVLTFEPGTDPIRARQMVAERLTQAHALPNVSKPPVMLQPLSTSNRVMMVSLTSDELSLIDMSVLARWTVRPRLMGVPGVANVAIWGQRERQLQVLVDPQRLASEGVSLEHVVKAAGNALWVSPLTFLEASTPGTGGFIDTPNQRLNVQHVLPIDSAEDLARVVVEPEIPGAAAPLLGDVADVVEDHQPLIGDALVNADPGLLLVVEKFPEAGTLEVTAALEDALHAMGPGLSGITVDTTLFRPATYLESAIDSFTVALGAALVLVAAALFVLMRDWRAAVIALASITVSTIAAGMVLLALGLTVNVMVVGGFIVAAGVVVDDAIGTTLAARTRLAERRTDFSEATRFRRITGALVDVRVPVTYASLAVLLAAAPLLLLGGVPGAMLPPLLLAFAVALLVSSLVAATFTAALAMSILPRQVQRRDPRLTTRVRDGYASVLRRGMALGRSASAVIGFAAVAGVLLFAASMAPRIDAAGMPPPRDRDILIHWDGAAGTSHTEMTRVVRLASDELGQLDGVRTVGAHVGRAIQSDQVVSISSGEIWLTIEADADYDATLSSIEATVAGYPGLRRAVTTYATDRINDVAVDARDDVVVRVYGQELEVLRQKASEIRDVMASVEGVESATVEPQVDAPTVEIEVNLAAAERHGLKPGDVRRAAATLLSGIEVGSLFEDQKVFEVVVWGTPAVRLSVDSIRGLTIPTLDDGVVRLDEVADVRIAAAPTVIRRDAVQRRIDIGATVTGRDVGAVLADLDQALASVTFPLETHAEILDHTELRHETFLTILAVIGAAAIGIFLLLQAALSSWRRAFLALLVLPAALTGGMLAALAAAEPGSPAVIAGLLGTLAVAVRHLVMLGIRVAQLERHKGRPSDANLVIRAARERLVPALGTTVVTAAALAPLVVLGAWPGLELAQPIALVMLGGLVTTTLVNLFLAPALFLTTGPGPVTEPVATGAEPAPEPHAIGAR